MTQIQQRIFEEKVGELCHQYPSELVLFHQILLELT